MHFFFYKMQNDVMKYEILPAQLKAASVSKTSYKHVDSNRCVVPLKGVPRIIMGITLNYIDNDDVADT